MANAASASGFTYPMFWSYPPYFTLQPIKDTRDKQLASWRQLILTYCKASKVYVVSLGEEFPPFHNREIERHLSAAARTAVLDDLVANGCAIWLDLKSKSQCLILWRKIEDWAAVIYTFVKTYGLQDSVMTLDDLMSGDDVRGSELQGLHRELLLRALRVLEAQGKARMFSGSAQDEEGVKFL